MLSVESSVLLLWLQCAAWATWSFPVVVLWLCCAGNSLYALLWCGAWAAGIHLWRRSGCGVMQFLPEAEPALTLTLVLFFGVMSSFICSSFSRQQLLHLEIWTHWAASTQWEVSFLPPEDKFSANKKRTRVNKVAKRHFNFIWISSPEFANCFEMTGILCYKCGCSFLILVNYCPQGKWWCLPSLWHLKLSSLMVSKKNAPCICFHLNRCICEELCFEIDTH